MSDTISFAVSSLKMVSSPNVQDNLEQAEALIEKAVLGGAKLVALPEYFCFMGHSDTDKFAVKEKKGKGVIQSFLSE